VMRLAGEHDIDMKQVRGAEFNARITKKDILKVIEDPSLAGEKTKESAEPEKQQASAAPVENTQTAPGEEIPVSGVRAAIANKMVQSSTEIPHAWLDRKSVV